MGEAMAELRVQLDGAADGTTALRARRKDTTLELVEVVPGHWVAEHDPVEA